MDKTRDVRSEFSRSNKKYHLLVSGSIEEESRREKLSRLSVVEEMRPDGAETAPRKLKLPRKIFVDSSTVAPASVPRKLRSAIKKRSSEPASSSLPESNRLSRLVNGVESLRKDCLKKSKISMKNSTLHHAPKRASLVSISKDEEEVAETLSALAGMIPLNEVHMKKEIGGGCMEAKALEFAEKLDDSMLARKGSVILEEEPNATCHPTISEVINVTPVTDGSPRESVQTTSPFDTTALSRATLSQRRQLNLNLQVSVPPVNLQRISPLLRTCDQRSWVDSNFLHPTEANLEKGLREIKQEKGLLCKSELHLNIGAVDAVSSQERRHSTSVERSDNGFPPRVTNGSGVDGLSRQPSATMLPSWLGAVTSSSGVGTREDIASIDTAACSINVRGKSWKKCAAHIYISRLIQVLQISEGKGILPSDSSQLRPSQCIPGVGGETNGMLTASHMYISGSYRNAHETANRVPVNRKNHQEQEEGPSFSACCASKKQSFDFLSLSAGMGSTADNGINITGNSLEVETKNHLIYLQSAGQHNIPVSFSMLQNHLPSDSYRNQVAGIPGPLSVVPQVHLQMPPYFGNPFGPTHMGSTTKAAQQRQPQPKQQQQSWTVQLATQFRPGPLLSSHIVNCQNKREDMRSLTHHMPTLLPTSQASLEMLGAKYLHSSQQPPQRLIARGLPSPPVRAKSQLNQFPSICEDNGGRFRADGVLPMQVLCNEQL